jgi:hypothetical protein
MSFRLNLQYSSRQDFDQSMCKSKEKKEEENKPPRKAKAKAKANMSFHADRMHNSWLTLLVKYISHTYI